MLSPAWRRRAVFILQSVVVGLAAAFVLTYAWPGRNGARDSEANRSAPASYSTAVKRATPSVVNIYTRRLVTEQPFRVFSDPVLQRFTGVPAGPQRSRLQRILGAGVIVREDGYVLTNFHVVQGAGDILAELADGRVTPAQVIGTDRDTDLAVLKIAGTGFTALPAAPEGSLDVGDVVLAIGNPLGLGQTVTLGIVSATGRNQTSLSRYEDFIQTDAAINQGSSGGALVNAAGELVGINSRLSGEGQGIGFAIPVRAALRVLDQIIANGRVVRGWMGAEYTDAALSASPLAEPIAGAQIALVLPGGPADRAGLRQGDIVQRLGGESIRDEADLRSRESAIAPGTAVRVQGQRGGAALDVQVTLVDRGAALPPG